jgi:DNA-binding beta-propeller fold protein YncE
VIAITWLCAGCPATGDEIRPPPDQFYFPTGMEMAPDESVLFVANANSDLRYDSGAVSVVSLDRVDDLIAQWLEQGVPPEGRDCEVDLSVPYTLVCGEGEAILADGSVRIGNFATELKVQTLGDDSLRLFVAVRGDPSLTWIDYNRETRDLSCSGREGFNECDDEHRLTQLRNDEDLIGLPDEPFGLFVDSAKGYVIITHLSNGAVSVANAPPNGNAPILSDAVGNLFLSGEDGQRGAVGVAGRRPGTDNDRIYVTSRRESRVQTLIVQRGRADLPSLLPAEYFFMRGTVNPSNDGRGIAFSDDGNRAYIVNRSPAMLHIFDTSLDPVGVPRNEFISSVEVCAEASNLEIVPGDDPADPEASERGERVYVACFRNGQIWSIDPRGPVVDAIIDVGRGPHAIAAAPGRKRLYVSNNLEGTVAVIDLTPESDTENRVVLRLGRPRSPGDDVE